MSLKPDKALYIQDPCNASSLPYWKTLDFEVPNHIKIVRDDRFEGIPEGYVDESYFKMVHPLSNLIESPLDPGYAFLSPSPEQLCRHIGECYEIEGVTLEELLAYNTRETYRPELWLGLFEKSSGKLVASGIAELDDSIGEGALEWIQVSPDYRRKGLGLIVINELLSRLKRLGASFVTVSGKVQNANHVDVLYRKCGFVRPVIWHVLRRED